VERCPIFPSVTKRLHWFFPDPASLRGPREARLEQTRHVRDLIAGKVDEWCAEVCGANLAA